jgi:hypothetical protein
MRLQAGMSLNPALIYTPFFSASDKKLVHVKALDTGEGVKAVEGDEDSEDDASPSFDGGQ